MQMIKPLLSKSKIVLLMIINRFKNNSIKIKSDTKMSLFIHYNTNPWAFVTPVSLSKYTPWISGSNPGNLSMAPIRILK